MSTHGLSQPLKQPKSAQDVFMTLGCSEALSHCIAALAAPGSDSVTCMATFVGLAVPLLAQHCSRRKLMKTHVFCEHVVEDCFWVFFLVMACYLQAKPCVITVSHSGNLLLPRPGFPLYQVLCRGLNICFSCYRYGVNEKFSPNCWQNRLVYHEFMVWNRWNHAGDYHGVEVRYYDLLPDQGWQCNIGDIAKLVVWVPVSSKNFTCHCRIRKNPVRILWFVRMTTPAACWSTIPQTLAGLSSHVSTWLKSWKLLQSWACPW